MVFNPRTPTPPELAASARAHGGSLARAHIQRFGISRKECTARLNAGYWIRHLGTVGIPQSTSNPDSRDAHALIHRIPDGIITGPTAARLQGIPIESNLVIISCPVETHARVPGARILRRKPVYRSSENGGLRLADSREAVLDTVLYSPWKTACRLLDTAMQRRWLTVEFIAETLAIRRANRQHTRGLRAVYRRIRGGTHSEGERRMRALLRRHRLGGWKSNWLLSSADGTPIALLDFANLERKIAIEFDGRAFHSDDGSFEHDRWRQSQVARLGWIVLRFTWDQVVNRQAAVAATVREVMATREATPRLRAETHR